MIYRGPGFLAVEWFGSSPPPSLDRRHIGRLRKRENLLTRELWRRRLIIRQPDSLVLYKPFNSFNTIWFGSPPPRQLDRRHTGRLRKIDNFLTGEGGWDGGGAKSWDGEKAWSSINHSILFGCSYEKYSGPASKSHAFVWEGQLSKHPVFFSGNKATAIKSFNDRKRSEFLNFHLFNRKTQEMKSL
jgi:hypothetical protein